MPIREGHVIDQAHGSRHMAQNIYYRLRQYYLKVATVLRGEADAADVFPNPTDIGEAREQIYATFLRQHAPSKCNVFLGGFLFHEDGSESKQLDVIVTTDTTPRFNFHNPTGEGKAFSPIEGTLGVASIKSTLNKEQLFDALKGIASIPPMESLENRIPLFVKIKNYDDWPYKIIYASDGINGETVLNYLQDYYAENSHIPLNRRPHIVHVAGKYAILRLTNKIGLRYHFSGQEKRTEIGTFELMTHDPDLQALLFVLGELQEKAATSTYILFRYNNIINRVMKGIAPIKSG